MSAIRPVLLGAHLASWDEPAAATCPTRVNKCAVLLCKREMEDKQNDPAR